MKIPEISRQQATPESIGGALRDVGAIIVHDMMSAERRTHLMAELDGFIEATAAGEDGFSGTRTTRTGALAARSATAQSMILDPLILPAAKDFLRPWCDQIQLHVTQVIRILPGQKAQPLHRDRWAWGHHLPRVIEPQFNTMWALTDFTAENGATVVVPGSHQREDNEWTNELETLQAQMPAGSVLIFSGSVVHGGGANATDQVRVGVNIDYCLGWLRQEENQYLCCPPDVARGFPTELQRLCGYAFGSTNLGYFSYPKLVDSKAGVLPPQEALRN